jgi:CRP/FNR family cyclic AMP-dependent transcriptional regulator
MPGGPVSTLPPAASEALAKAGRPRHYGRGEVVCHEGDPGDVVHLIQSGRVAARLSTSRGESVTLSVMGPGEVFGEMALFNERDERTATIVALEAVETLTLRKEAFHDLRHDHPEVSDMFLRLLARRAERLSGLVAEAHFVPVDRRVARRLYEVGRLYLGDGVPVVVPLTQDDVAGLAGTTRPTANQALRRLEELGLVRLARGRVEILDPPGLRARTGW